MVAKLSQQETGAGEGVEVLVNEPFENEQYGKGQYTKKIYHLGKRVPGWVKAIAPASALQLHEQAWNAYPYCRTELTCPFLAKFYIRIETWHKPGVGEIENVHSLTGKPLQKRVVDFIDIVTDKVKKVEPSEDPLTFHSQKTGRGPWAAGWQQSGIQPMMCAYKLVTCEFDYFGLQGKIENLVSSFERDLFLKSHRQLVCWMDEWHGLTIGDIRRIEEETKRRLEERLKDANAQSSGALAAE